MVAAAPRHVLGVDDPALAGGEFAVEPGGEKELGKAVKSAFEMLGVELVGENRAPRFDSDTMQTNVDNLYIALTARSMRPSLFIVARSNNSTAEPKLRQAGVDRVVNTHEIGGSRMAALVLQPDGAV